MRYFPLTMSFLIIAVTVGGERMLLADERTLFSNAVGNVGPEVRGRIACSIERRRRAERIAVWPVWSGAAVLGSIGWACVVLCNCDRIHVPSGRSLVRGLRVWRRRRRIRCLAYRGEHTGRRGERGPGQRRTRRCKSALGAPASDGDDCRVRAAYRYNRNGPITGSRNVASAQHLAPIACARDAALDPGYEDHANGSSLDVWLRRNVVKGEPGMLPAASTPGYGEGEIAAEFARLRQK